MQAVIPVGIRQGTGDHHDFPVNGVQGIHRLIQLPDNFSQRADGIFEAEGVFPCLQINEIRLLPARDDHLPVQRIREGDIVQLPEGNLAVDIDAAVGFGAVHIIVAAADGQLIQAGLRDGEIPLDPLRGEAPVFSADGIHFYGVYVVRGGHGRGPVIDRIQHGGGFAVCCLPLQGNLPGRAGCIAVRRQIIRIIRLRRVVIYPDGADRHRFLDTLQGQAVLPRLKIKIQAFGYGTGCAVNRGFA